MEPLTFAEFLQIVPRGPLSVVGLVFGLIFGSFFNVVIYRLPRGLSVSKPRSFCPSCKTPIPWYRNVPVLAYLALTGHCAVCKEPISFRYPVVEMTSGLIFAAALYRWGVSWAALSSIIFGAAMLVLALIDYDVKLLPNKLTLPGIAVGLALSFANPRVDWVDAFLGAALGGGVLYGVAWLYFAVRRQEGMGMGDVKMIAMIGAFVGWQGVLLTIFIGSLLGSVVGVTLIGIKGRDWGYALPFGTFLAAAAVIVDWGGGELIGWYLGLFAS